MWKPITEHWVKPEAQNRETTDDEVMRILIM